MGKWNFRSRGILRGENFRPEFRPSPYPHDRQTMKNPHAFLITTSATIAAGCAAFAVALAPVDGNKFGTAAGFTFWAAMAGAGVALTAAATADALANGGR